MTAFPETSQALKAFTSDELYASGSHRSDQITTGVPGQLLGTEQFDPARHDVSAINPLAIMGMVSGEQHVNVVRPTRPLTHAVLFDATLRQEAPAAREAKVSMAHNISTELSNGLSTGVTDSGELVVVSDSRDLARELGGRYVRSREAVGAEALRLMRAHSLLFVVSDLSGIALPKVGETPAIVVKANHQLERRMPELDQRIAVGYGRELDTMNEVQRAAYDKRAEALHQRRIGQLAALGYQVADAVTDPHQSTGYDVTATDVSIAAAVQAAGSRKR